MNPEPSNWLSIRHTYEGWGYSPLDQINASNVKNLRPRMGFSTGETKVHEAAPLVNKPDQDSHGAVSSSSGESRAAKIFCA